MTGQQAPSARDVFRIPSYALFWAGRVLSSLSYQMIGVAVGWQIYALTGSTFALGMVGLAQFLPLLLLVFVFPLQRGPAISQPLRLP